MKQTVISVWILLLLVVFPLPAIKKDTKLILEEIQKLADTVSALDKKINVMAAELTGMIKKSDINEERIGAMSRNQADMTQNRENLLLSMQFFKEELNDIKNSLNKLNDKIMNIPATAGASIPVSTTLLIPIISRKILTWPLKVSDNSSVIFRKAAWLIIPCTG
jgi:seryl-tRNA synthetase